MRPYRDFPFRGSGARPVRGAALAWAMALATAFASTAAHAETLRYSGKVVDGSGAPLAWALLDVAGTNISAQADANGDFAISGTATTAIRAAHPGSGLPPHPMPEGYPTYRADGRLALSATSSARFPRPAAPDRVEARAAEGLAVTLRGPADRDPAPGAPASKPSAAAAAWTLEVSMAHYAPGAFPQSGATASGLVLALSPSATDTAFDTEAKRACLDTLNALRASLGKPKLAWSKSLEAFADQGARYDARTGQAHSHFQAYSKSASPSDAENALPGWPLKGYKSMTALVQAGTKMMWDEGPGGGHYDNIAGDQKEVGCGIYATTQGAVWVIQDFK